MNYTDKDLDRYEDDNYDYDAYEGESRTYEEFAGTYAQDVMGYSDEEINDTFDGEPDAYWNIDLQSQNKKQGKIVLYKTTNIEFGLGL